MCCVGSLCSAEDTVTELVAVVCRGGHGDDCAGEFSATDPGERWLVLVFALDLEDIEEICAGRVDFD